MLVLKTRQLHKRQLTKLKRNYHLKLKSTKKAPCKVQYETI